MATPRLPLLLSELRRRHVFRVAAVYAVVAWLLVQIAVSTFPYLHLPAWMVTGVIAFALLGFPIALVLAWAFEITPEGVRRTEPGSPAASGRLRARVYTGVAILAGLSGAGAYAIWGGPARVAGASGPISSIAVLPFADLSPAGDQEYFSDGIAEELLDALARVEGLKVPARTSAFSFKGQSINIRDVGRALSVETVLEGSVRRSGNRLRITVQLVSVEDGYRLWGETYEREFGDIFAVQEEIAREIVSALRGKLPAGGERLVAARTPDPLAHALYLRGRYHWNRRARHDLERAAEYFREAAERDPGFAAAYTGIADAHAMLAAYSYVPPREALARAEAAARRALEIDPGSGEAYASLSWVHLYRQEWHAAEEVLRRATTLAPVYASAHHWYGYLLVMLGREREAMGEYDRALELDPLSPAVLTDRALLLHRRGDEDGALAQLRTALELVPDHSSAGIAVASIHSNRGKHAEAVVAAEQVLARNPGTTTRAIAAAIYARAGERERARHLVQRVERDLAASERHGGWSLAAAHFALGDDETAFHVLEDSGNMNPGNFVRLRDHPAAEKLRGDPRLTRVFEAAGLSP